MAMPLFDFLDSPCDDRGLFGRVVAITAAAHVAAVVLLQVIEPVEYYNADLLAEAARLSHAAAQPVNPEPKQPIPWGERGELTPTLGLRSVLPLDDSQRARLVEIAERAEALFVGYYGLAQRTQPRLELRVVSVATLNDPRFFNVAPDIGDRIYYGRYFPGHNIAYVTDVAWTRNTHLVHELAHYFSHAYDLGLFHSQEETRARWFEDYYVRYERLLAPRQQHVHAGALADGAPPPDWRHRERLADGSQINAAFFLTPKRREWLIETTTLATQLFPAHVDVPAIEAAPVTVNIVRRPLLADAEVWGAGLDRGRRGRYVAETSTIYLPPRVFATSGMLSHQLAHHLIAAYDLELSVAEEERVAYLFERSVQRVRRGEASVDSLFERAPRN